PAILTIRDLGPNRPGHSSTLLFLGFIVGAFTIGLLCGQVIRRSITAWVVACLGCFILVLPQVVLADAEMIPSVGLLLFPLIMLAVSWAWSGDWMNDLGGAARWLRLGAMAAAATALLGVTYIGYRAWSVPKLPPPPYTLDSIAKRSEVVAPEDDA